MKINRLYRCENLVEAKDAVSFFFIAEDEEALEIGGDNVSLRLDFFRGRKDLPDFKPGEIYPFQFETIPERVIRRNEEENLSPSMRID